MSNAAFGLARTSMDNWSRACSGLVDASTQQPVDRHAVRVLLVAEARSPRLSICRRQTPLPTDTLECSLARLAHGGWIGNAVSSSFTLYKRAAAGATNKCHANVAHS
jgi:hypothetical protein